MPKMQKGFAAAAVLVACLLLCPLVTAAANDLATISGRVHDSSGAPIVGALVVAAAAAPVLPERIALTDREGAFSIANLFAGEYTVKVSMPRFLSALKQGIELNAGGTAVLTVNLQNAMDIVRRTVTRDRSQSDDIVWTLRSSRSTQPVLRIAESAQKPEPLKSVIGPNYTGYFQLYSKSVETSSGTTEGVGSQFSVTMPLDPSSKVTVHGQYNESPMQPRGIGASYDFVPAAHHKAAVGVNIRQGALFGDPLQSDSLRELQVKYVEDFQWTDHLVFNYGTEVGRVGTLTGTTYLRPRFGISWVPERRTTVTLAASSQAPTTADDPVRGKEYYDRAILVPPALERYLHSEVGLTHVFSDGFEVSAAAFRDRIDTEALFVSTADGRRGILMLDTRNMPSEGVRVNVNRQFRNFEAGIGYTSVMGVGIDRYALTFDNMQTQLARRRFQSLAARFKADVDATQTEITAVYRWTSAFSASRLDPYQQVMEYNDPTLSLSIAQSLPTWRMFPGKVQAILDARNLLDQSFGAPRAQAGQYPRLVKGGINIKF
jgi:Carboxypeptidase regulatory-like domain